MAESLSTAVERGDVDALTRLVDALSASREWDRLVELRDRCEQAVARGRQLWPVAAHAEYRLALESPGPWAARVLVEGAGRVAPGPLPEGAASTHEWRDLAPHAPYRPPAVLTAAQRVVPGRDPNGAAPPRAAGPRPPSPPRGMGARLPLGSLPIRRRGPAGPDVAAARTRGHAGGGVTPRTGPGDECAPGRGSGLDRKLRRAGRVRHR